VLDLTALLLEELRGGSGAELEHEGKGGGSSLEEDIGKGASLEDEEGGGGKGASLEDEIIIGPSMISPGSFSSSSPYINNNKLSLPSLQDKTTTPAKTETSKNKRTLFINTQGEYLLVNIEKN
jgi:hypothetical protein